ncbi:MAG: hypothetical protein K8R23_20080 [Chthoniobacter sp.]|nr:hypothetical protein [Chthoniobacter sp.]
MSKIIERRFWLLLSVYERLTQDESVAIRARDFDTVDSIHARKPAVLEELCGMGARVGFDRKTAELGVRIERLTATETANAELIVEMLGEARLERQNLEVARQRLRSLNTLYAPESARAEGFCVHG